MGIQVSPTEYARWVREGLIPAESVPARHRPAHPAIRPDPRPDRNRRSFAVTITGLPIRSEANTGGKLRDRIKRKATVKEAVNSALGDLLPPSPLCPPFRVLLHRIGQQLLDTDNLAHAFKAVRDVVASWLNVDDGDTERIEFVYTQERSKQVGVRIAIDEV